MPLVTLRSYRDVVDAHLDKVRLEASEIRGFLLDEYVVGIQWLYSRAIGGVKLSVEESDRDRSHELLQEDRNEDLLAIPEIASTLDPVAACPSCGSESLRASQLQRKLAAISLLTTLPLFLLWKRWHCSSCGHSWKWPRFAPEASATLAAEWSVHEARSFPILRAAVPLLLIVVLLHFIRSQIRGF